MSILSFFTVQKTLVLVVALIALITDLKHGRIYNKLTFPAMGLGWALAFATGGANELGYSLLATFVAIILYIPFAAFGFVGMGDVKLLAAIGAICGPSFMFSVFLYTGALGFIHAIIIQRLNYSKDAFGMLVASVKTGTFLKKSIHKENEHQLKYKFLLGIDLFIATLIACFYAFHW